MAACALAEGADVIVTRDAQAFNGLAVSKYSPGEYLSARGYEPVELAG